MAIINLTDDSFSGDGVGGSVSQAVARSVRAIEDGAHILDIGAESTRPGSLPATEADELARVVPVVKELARLGVPISVDTTKPVVMKAAADVGAAIVNDINALREAGAEDVVASTTLGVCLMHMQGLPRSMQNAPVYKNVVAEVSAFLSNRVKSLLDRGVKAERIALDPGFGFGKTLEHNTQLFKSLKTLEELGLPVLVGVSRKSMLGAITGREVGDRMVASVVAAVLAVQRGARIIRVHDVAATRDALAVWRAL